MSIDILILFQITMAMVYKKNIYNICTILQVLLKTIKKVSIVFTILKDFANNYKVL